MYMYIYTRISLYDYIIIYLHNSLHVIIYIYMYTYTDRYEIGLAWIFVITSRVVGWLWLLVDLCVGQLCRRIAAGKGALVISW